ncbi:MAG: AsmA-like C-terminal region-containing protein, partial [Acidobacteriota bacterium]|nr:AsmA-like C-terminal region-containing protein [Acidobacteriota bacterium]
SGQFGPLNLVDPSQTAFSGDYTFRDADLGAFHGIAGKLFSQGKFKGTLGHIDIQGNTDTPAFEVTESHHAVHLGTQFQAYVNGENGDTFLNNVQSRIGKTMVYWRGKVAGTKGKPGKITSLEMSAQNGRIEDLLRMFVTADRPPMQGAISFKGTTLLPPGTLPFLKRIEIDGAFGIDAGRFTKPETQEGVNKLSENSESDEVIKAEKKAGEGKEKDSDAPLALSDIKGSVVVRNAVATFTKLSFSIPGASAEMHGTYNLISQNVDLHGELHMDSELSKTTHGFKSLLMKPLDPFFKKKHGSQIPVKVGGTFKHPTFGLELAKKG